MFRPVHLLPQFSEKTCYEFQERWKTEEGKKDYQKVTDSIKNGAGEDFLQWDFEQGEFSVLEDYHDLRGIEFWELDINFPKHDNFEGIDFSYAKGWHSHFKDATFPETRCEFARFYNFKFDKCLFGFSNWYGTTFEKVLFKECDFVEHDRFINCRFIECLFENCFFSENAFEDCSFDVQTKLSKIKLTPNSSFHTRLETKSVSELYKGIKDAYLAGEVFDSYRKYLFMQKHSETKYLRKGGQKIHGYLNEALTGYGVKPINTLLVAVLVVLTFGLIFTLQTKDLHSSLVMSLSAFVGFFLDSGSSMVTAAVIEAGLGISIFALLITVLANVWFSEK